jgi:hypothetical protein
LKGCALVLIPLAVVSAIIELVVVLFPHTIDSYAISGPTNSNPEAPTVFILVHCGSLADWHPPTTVASDPGASYLAAHPLPPVPAGSDLTNPTPRLVLQGDISNCAVAHHKALLTILWMSPLGLIVIAAIVAAVVALIGVTFGGGGGGGGTIRGTATSYGGGRWGFRIFR